MTPSSRCCMVSPLTARGRFICFDQPPPSARQCRSHRSDGQRQRRRDFRVVQSLFPHQERFPIPLRQRVERSAGGGGILCQFDLQVLRRDLLRRPCFLRQELEVPPPAQVLSCFVANEVGRHG